MSCRTTNIRNPRKVVSVSDFTVKALTSETFGDFAALVERNAAAWDGSFTAV
jgi:hypothetical protein